ncbi:MAG TPA: methyl-accepting chemotaxis protein [Parasulfuritortus sp.]
MGLLHALKKRVAAKVLVVAAIGFVVELASSYTFSHYSERSLADDLLADQVRNIADNYFDSLNKLMLTGGMANRAELRKAFLAQSDILEARVIRGDAVKGQYGPGEADEAPVDALDQAALAGKESVVIRDTDKGRQMTIVRPYKATADTRGVNCLQCHSVPEGTVLGVVRITHDLAPTDARIRANDLVTALINIALFSGGFLLLIWLMKRFVTSPINHLSEVMSQVERESNLQLRIPPCSEDEICGVAHSFNTMLDRFAAMLLQVRQNTERLSTLAHQLVATAADSEQGVGRQLDDTEALGQVLQRLSQTVQQVAEDIRDAAAAARGANAQAKDGTRVAGTAVDAIRTMSVRLQGAAGDIRQLDTDSRDIGGVLGLIREVADQTNLLALNAAIEAARAGEAGRGFAVVADEVRNLAQRTQDATGEIEAIIARLQANAERAVGTIREAEAQSRQSVDFVQDTAAALGSISEAVDHITQMTARVAESAQSQGHDAEDITHRVADIGQVARESAASSHQVHDAAEQLAGIAEELSGQVARFKQ